jgi:hypothetical protein
MENSPIPVSEPAHCRRLVQLVRPEFRAFVLVPRPGDPVFSTPLCTAAECPRSSYQQGLCLTHWKRWDRAGRPGFSRWLASAGPATGCSRASMKWQELGYGGGGEGCLCGRYAGAFAAAGETELEKRLEPLTGPTCAASEYVASARRHRDELCWDDDNAREHVVGSPPLDKFLPTCATNAEPRFVLRGLPAVLRLEIQYILQRRADEGRVRTLPRRLNPLLKLLAASGVVSLLDCPPDRWSVLMNGKGATNVTRAFLRYALDELILVAGRLGEPVSI